MLTLICAAAAVVTTDAFIAFDAPINNVLYPARHGGRTDCHCRVAPINNVLHHGRHGILARCFRILVRAPCQRRITDHSSRARNRTPHSNLRAERTETFATLKSARVRVRGRLHSARVRVPARLRATRRIQICALSARKRSAQSNLRAEPTQALIALKSAR